MDFIITLAILFTAFPVTFMLAGLFMFTLYKLMGGKRNIVWYFNHL